VEIVKKLIVAVLCIIGAFVLILTGWQLRAAKQRVLDQKAYAKAQKGA
jgi:threonine/homoserine/homoserine lactone efflux protein